MSAVRGRDTRPELGLRRALHGLGFRYRLNVRALPGSPDLVFPSRRALIFVHGCFWHGHDCPLFVLPQTRRGFWLDKLGCNQERDRSNHDALVAVGWRVATVWECAMRGRQSLGIASTADRIAGFLNDPGSREAHVRDTGFYPGAGLAPPLARRFEVSALAHHDRAGLDRDAE